MNKLRNWSVSELFGPISLHVKWPQQAYCTGPVSCIHTVCIRTIWIENCHITQWRQTVWTKSVLGHISHTAVENLMWICHLLANLHCWMNSSTECVHYEILIYSRCKVFAKEYWRHCRHCGYVFPLVLVFFWMAVFILQSTRNTYQLYALHACC